MIEFKSYDQLFIEPLGICGVVGCDVERPQLVTQLRLENQIKEEKYRADSL